MPRLPFVSIALLMLLSAGSVCIGQWSDDPAVNTAIATPAGDAYYPEVMNDGSDGAIVVWHDFRSGPTSEMFAQKIDRYGVAQWASDGVLVSSAPGHQWGTTLASDGDGGVIVAFHDERSGGAFDVYAQRIDRNGVARWTVNGVPIAVSGSHDLWPNIVSDGNGGAIIAWENGDIYAQRIDSTGTVQWTPNGVAVCAASGEQRFPKLVSDGAGGAVIAWQDARVDWDVYAQRIDGAGVVQWGVDGVPVATTVGFQEKPSLIPEGPGGAIIAWEDSRGSSRDMYAQKIDGSGAAMWDSNGVPLTLEFADQTVPFIGHGTATVIASDGAGGAIVTWTDARNGALDIYAQRIDASGSVLWAPNGNAVSAASGNQADAVPTADGVGGAIIVWVDGRNGNLDLYAQRVDAYGSMAWTADGVPVSKASNNQDRPRITGHSAGGAVIAWQDSRNSSVGIFAQNIHHDGQLGGAAPLLITSPTASEEWFVGESYPIGWIADSTVDSVDIDLSADGGASWTPVAAGVAASAGLYIVEAPDLPAPNRTMAVRLRSADDPLINARSPAFSLVADSLDFHLVASYPFDGHPGDVSGYGNDAAPDDPILGQDRFGRDSMAYAFDGVTDRMRIGDPEVLRITGSMTISCWVRVLGFPAGRAASQLIFRGDDRYGLDPYYLAVMPSGSLRFFIASTSQADFIESPISYGVWHHIAAILDTAAGKMLLVVDGDTAAWKASPVRPFRDLDPSQSPGLGLGNTGSFNPGDHHQPLQGSLDDVRLYRRALSAGEILVLYGAESHIITASAGPHGTITPAGNQYVQSGGQRRFTFTPETGYHLDSVLVDGFPVDSTEGFTFTDVTASHTIRVTFAINRYAIAANVEGQGTIDPSGVVEVDHGATVSFSFTPEPGFDLVALYVDGSLVDSSDGYTFHSVVGPHSILAVYGRVRVRSTLSVRNGLSANTLAFGFSIGAADGIFRVDPQAQAPDSLEGESELPPAVTGTFDARFVAPSGSGLLFGGGSWVDVRRFSGPGQRDTFQIACQAPAGDNPYVIKWSKEYIAGAFAGTVLMDGGSIDMKLADSAIFPPEKNSIQIVTTDPTVSHTYAEGWNLISIPFDVAATRGEFFPTASSDAFAFRSATGYIERDTLRPGEGYWLKFGTTLQHLGFSGDSLLTDTIAVEAGWNLVGAISRPVSTVDILTVPDGLLSGAFYEYSGGYHAVNSLAPAEGYWVKATGPGQLIFTQPEVAGPGTVAGIPADGLGQIRIIDARGREQTLHYGEAGGQTALFELPPVPPHGLFDVRFQGDTRLLGSGEVGSSANILVSGAEPPILIRWSDPAGQNVRIELAGVSRPLSRDGELQLSAIPSTIRLVLEPVAVPGSFRLSEGYPNPFNPSTAFNVDLPVDAHVSINVYDILGSVVASLVDEQWNAGSRTVRWDAAGLPSGVYYCRIVAGNLSQSRKVLLMK